MLEIGIPYYNASSTLDTTLSSIAMQSERKRILVTICDDCSTEPREKLDTIIMRYSNLLKIRVLSTDFNGGAGVARNKIIDEARGEFLMFVDADDALCSPLAVKVILHEMYRKRPDFAYFGFNQECNETIIEMDLKNNTWVHGKIWNTIFLEKTNIHFPAIRYNEDTAFCTLAVNLAESIYDFDYQVYTWMNNQNSTVRSIDDYYSCGILDFLEGRIYTYRELVKRGLKEKAEKDFIWNLPSLFNIYIDLYNGAPNIVQNYTISLGKKLREIEYSRLINHPDVRQCLFKSYYKTKFSPRYGLYIPHVGMLQYFNFALEQANEVN